MSINKNDYLNPALLKEFRQTISSSKIFCKSEKLRKKYNLICVVIDRLESSLCYLNNHNEVPQSEEAFVCFLVYACITRDAILKLYENIFQKKPDFVANKHYFKEVKLYSKNAFTEEKCPTDDVFFEYLRSMAFAHPFDTNKRRGREFFETNEKQYCPWVIVQNQYVGIRVYTSSEKFIINDLIFPFENLKEYIKFIYEHLNEINIWAKEEIIVQDEEWKKHRVDRDGTANDLLSSIRSIYNERFLESYDIDRIDSYLNCKSSNSQNDDIIKAYREVLLESLYKISDALDSCYYDDLDLVINKVFLRPRNSHHMMLYQLEKIYCYLDDDHSWMDVDWGLKQAKEFAKGFASKWVVIETDKMNFDEIKLLVTIACYYEAKDQESNIE